MANSKTKFSISLQINFEGTREVGQQIQQGVANSLGGLMSAQARLLAIHDAQPHVTDATIIDGAAASNGDAIHGTPDGNGVKPKQLRQKRGKNGPSIANLLLNLKQETFFSQVRTSADVLLRLKDKGHSPPDTTVLTGLQRMVKKDELYREKNKKVWIYKDTPFNESPRNPSPAEQPTE